MNLNDKQLEAVNDNNNYIRVIAGAGSGKTRVLTERIKRLLNEGVSPERILAITFTNKAAKEMITRVGNPNVQISTIHALCVKILRKDYIYPKFRILDSDEQLDVLKEIYEKEYIDEKQYKLKDSLEIVQGAKLHRLNKNFEPPKSYPYKILYEKYREKLEEMKAMDFDDLIINTVELFGDESIKYSWASKFLYILVDEFQDTDRLQYQIMKDLSSVNKKLFVVGDGDQMIYSWRGSEEGIFNNFDKDFENCKTIIMAQNYRSTKKILDAANMLIANNENRIAKDLWTDSKEGNEIIIKQFADEQEEARWIVDKIIQDRSTYQLKDNVILYRSNYLSKPLEKEFLRNRIAYEVVGGYKFYDRKEVKDLMGYLKFISYKDDISLKRIINTPVRGIGKMKLKTISDIALEKRKSIWECLIDKDYESKETSVFINLIKSAEQLNFWEILDYILEETKYVQTLDDSDKAENVGSLLEEIDLFKESNENASLEDFLNETALMSETIKTKDGDKVEMMTIHTAKGLEYPNVYIVGLSEGKFPKNNNKVEEEDRRLAYVAYTRAKENLYLCTEARNYAGPTEPSIFLKEIGAELKSPIRPKRQLDWDW